MTEHFLRRLNKIGKNPSIVSNREDLQTDCRTVSALVSAIAVQEPDPSSEEEPEPQHNSISLHHLSIGRALARLPRPKSENNFSRPQEAVRRSSSHRPSFHKSDIIFKAEVGHG